MSFSVREASGEIADLTAYGRSHDMEPEFQRLLTDAIILLSGDRG